MTPASSFPLLTPHSCSASPATNPMALRHHHLAGRSDLPGGVAVCHTAAPVAEYSVMIAFERMLSLD